MSVLIYAHLLVSRLRFAITELQFRNNMRTLSLRQGNLHLPFPVSCKTYNTRVCQVLLRNVAGPTDEHHGIFKEMQDVVEAESALQAKFGHKSQDSAFEIKNATMPDAETEVSDAFVDKRPLLVLDEAKTEGALPKHALLKYGLGSVAELQIPMSREFDDQWTSSYLPMIFPCSLNYRCGGAEYPDLFSNWDNLASDAPSKLDLGIKGR